TVMVAGSTPSPIQPSSKAPPIFPAPTRTMLTARLGEPDEFDMEDLTTVPMGNSTSRARLRLPRGLEHGRVERLAGALAGPYHELEGLVVTFAGIERDTEHRLALRVGCGDTGGEHDGVAKHDDTVIEPGVEMADPELLVDQRGQLDDFAAAAFRDLEF